MAAELAKCKGKVVIAARDEMVLEETRKAVSQEGYWCHAISMDVSSSESVMNAIKDAEAAAGGPIDVRSVVGPCCPRGGHGPCGGGRASDSKGPG